MASGRVPNTSMTFFKRERPFVYSFLSLLIYYITYLISLKKEEIS